MSRVKASLLPPAFERRIKIEVLRPLPQGANSRLTTDCWLWTGRIGKRGYVDVWSPIAKKTMRAHRVVYELLVGPIPDGLMLDHLCRTRHCVNPDHLEPVTVRENTLRGFGPTAQHARQTHCKRGHPFDDQNTIHTKFGRNCRECQKTHMSNWYDQHGRKGVKIIRQLLNDDEEILVRERAASIWKAESTLVGELRELCDDFGWPDFLRAIRQIKLEKKLRNLCRKRGAEQSVSSILSKTERQTQW